MEVLVAIFLITVGVLGAMTVVNQTTTFTQVTSSRLVAAYLAQEGIEIVRNIRDGNWLENRDVTTSWKEGLTACSAGCEIDYNNFNNPGAEDPSLQSYNGGQFLRIDPTSGFYNYTSGDETKFKRKITITEDSDKLKVSVTVYWDSHEITVEEYLYNWRK